MVDLIPSIRADDEMTCSKQEAVDYVLEVRAILTRMNTINRMGDQKRKETIERLNFIKEQLQDYREENPNA